MVQSGVELLHANTFPICATNVDSVSDVERSPKTVKGTVSRKEIFATALAVRISFPNRLASK